MEKKNGFYVYNPQKEDEDAEELGKYLTNYGTSADKGISAKDLSPSMFNWNGSGTNGKQDKVITYIGQLALSGEIEDGTVIDLNYGSGDGHYLYYKGSFYPTDRPVTKGWDAEDIYQQKIPHPKPKNSDIVWYPPMY